MAKILMARSTKTPIGATGRTGENCPESGVWKVIRAGETAPIAEGDTFPPYKGQSVTWKLIQYA